MKWIFVFFAILILAAASMTFVVALKKDLAQPLADCSEEEENTVVDLVVMGRPAEPCTVGATWCESRTCGARMSTCGAGGTWGAWVGCGSGSICTVEGYNGRC